MLLHFLIFSSKFIFEFICTYMYVKYNTYNQTNDMNQQFPCARCIGKLEEYSSLTFWIGLNDGRSDLASFKHITEVVHIHLHIFWHIARSGNMGKTVCFFGGYCEKYYDIFQISVYKNAWIFAAHQKQMSTKSIKFFINIKSISNPQKISKLHM